MTLSARIEPSILVVDDEESFVASLVHALSREGYKVYSASDGPTALSRATTKRPDVILLDLMLPGMSGLSVCRAIREQPDYQPGIIMVTAKDTDVDEVVGLESGADDYVTKPFNLSLLLARIRALLRRQKREQSPQPKPEHIVLGDLEILPGAYEAYCNHTAIDLSPRLFAILLHLAQRLGQVCTRDELLNQVWGYDYAGETRTVDVHVHWLREHLERAGCTRVEIQTVRGVGYKLVMQGDKPGETHIT